MAATAHWVTAVCLLTLVASSPADQDHRQTWWNRRLERYRNRHSIHHYHHFVKDEPYDHLGYGGDKCYGYGSQKGYGYGSHKGYGHGSQTGYGHGSQTGYGHGSQTGYGHGSQTGYGHGSQTGYGHGRPGHSRHKGHTHYVHHTSSHTRPGYDCHYEPPYGSTHYGTDSYSSGLHDLVLHQVAPHVADSLGYSSEEVHDYGGGDRYGGSYGDVEYVLTLPLDNVGHDLAQYYDLKSD